MPKFLPSQRSAALALLASVAGCAGVVHAINESTPHPAPLVGEWVDSLHTSAADTALWVLREDGQDLSVHLAPDSMSRAGHVVTSRRHGYWYLAGSLTDSTSRSLCFNTRPGRSAPTCLAFSFDSPVHPSRLEVFGYQGEHRKANRVLLRRSVP